MRRILCTLLSSAILLALATGAHDVSAGSPIFELFSSADGKLQFIQLADVSPQQIAGMSLTVEYPGGEQRFVFPAGSLLGPPRGNDLLIVSKSLSERPLFGPGGGASQWDYVMPDGFLPLNGASLTLGNLDQWTYARLPQDGASALFRVGGVGLVEANSSQAGVVVRFDIDDLRFVSEYADAPSRRHFFTAFDAEIAALNSGVIAGWHSIWNDYPGMTGFVAYGRRVEAMSHEVCRFYVPPPSDAHFFTASEQECAAVQAQFPDLVLETSNAFYVGLPDPGTGKCGIGLWPLYRLWNPATNDHWYTADDQVQQIALALGYVREGYGEAGVGMCIIPACTGGC